ncbi:MAG: SufS family cysteine desulfurase [bacterium]|nr:SufS family cysteine desulfurase [bacterium]
MDISKDIKSQFPILDRLINGKRLVFLDNAASAQKPKRVMDAMNDLAFNHYANVNRGVYALSEESTKAVEDARMIVAKFINCKDDSQIIFTKNTTESINLVAYGWARKNLKKGDVIVVTEMEHHSNIVPWQVVCEEIGCVLQYVEVSGSGYLEWDQFVGKLSNEELAKIKLICVTHVSNVLGTINPIAKITKWAHDNQILVLVDGAQGVTQFSVDVSELDVDFYVFSGHKIYGPTGVGVLYAKREILEAMSPFLTGGDMILEVKKYTCQYQEIPHKFEAGTPPILEIVGLGEAIKFINEIGIDNIEKHNKLLLTDAYKRLILIENLTLYGPTNMDDKVGVLAFTVNGAHAHDIATVLNEHGVSIRSGHHCAQVLCEKLGQSALARVSFGVYNTVEDVEVLIEVLSKVNRIFNS